MIASGNEAVTKEKVCVPALFTSSDSVAELWAPVLSVTVVVNP